MRRLTRTAVGVGSLGLALAPATAASGVALIRPSVEGTATAAHSPTTVAAPITSAAWFQPDPLCSTPLGCGAVPLPALSPYPKGTFHIGTALGRQTARSFIGVTLSKAAQAAHGGTLSIPLDVSPADGSVAPDTASINVCVVYQPVVAVEGAFDGAPAPNCLPAAPATYVAKPVPRLVADLAPLGGKLAAVKGFALLPAQAKPTSAWQVVFKLPRSGAPAATMPKLTLLVGKAQTTAPSPSGRHVEPSPGAGSAGVPAVPEPVVPPDVVTAQPPSNPQPVVAPRPAGHFVTVGYQYPEVWLLPLALIGLVPFTIRAMTKDLSRPRAEGGR